MKDNLKKRFKMQYFSLMLFATVSIVIPLLGFVVSSMLEPGSHADGLLIIMIQLFSGLFAVTVMPAGIIIAILSTAALYLNKNNKRKVALILNLICTIIVLFFAYSFSGAGANPISIILWGIVITNMFIMFFYKPKDLQEKLKLNNED